MHQTNSVHLGFRVQGAEAGCGPGALRQKRHVDIYCLAIPPLQVWDRRSPGPAYGIDAQSTISWQARSGG